MSVNFTPKVETPFKENASRVNVPATPFLHKIGYGTGVSVYHLDRSPKLGSIQSPWAVKKVNRTGNEDCYSERVRKEAEILKSLDHPNIVGFRGFIKTEDGRDVLVMEECRESLGDLIEKHHEMDLGPMEPKLIYTVILGVSRALDYLHSRSIVHGDIKSYNILIKGDFETVKLCDFGVSFTLNSDGTASADDYTGTASWNAPETIMGDYITSKADIFALGLTVWEMLALTPPHTDINSSMMTNCSTDMDESILSCESSFESKIGTRPDLPDVILGPEYEHIIDIYNQCTEHNADKRPTARKILEKLKSIGIE